MQNITTNDYGIFRISGLHYGYEKPFAIQNGFAITNDEKKWRNNYA